MAKKIKPPPPIKDGYVTGGHVDYTALLGVAFSWFFGLHPIIWIPITVLLVIGLSPYTYESLN